MLNGFKLIFKKTLFYLKELKKGSIFAAAFREYLMRHSRRNGRVVECGSLENC
jgi:hypothetical protein